MKIAQPGSDYCVLYENNLEHFSSVNKIHLIKLAFKNPTDELIDRVFELYPYTNRFFVSDNIRFYNGFLKNTNKKYYVENTKGTGLVSFFRKNNKCILNFENLLQAEKDFIFDYAFEDVLYNLEVIMLTEKDLRKKEDILKHWSGNVLLV